MSLEDNYKDISLQKLAEYKYQYGHSGREAVADLQRNKLAGPLENSVSEDLSFKREYFRKNHPDVNKLLAENTDSSFLLGQLNAQEELTYITLELIFSGNLKAFVEKHPKAAQKLNEIALFQYALNPEDFVGNIDDVIKALSETYTFGPDKYHLLVSGLMLKDAALVNSDLMASISAEQSLLLVKEHFDKIKNTDNFAQIFEIVINKLEASKDGSLMDSLNGFLKENEQPQFLVNKFTPSIIFDDYNEANRVKRQEQQQEEQEHYPRLYALIEELKQGSNKSFNLLNALSGLSRLNQQASPIQQMSKSTADGLEDDDFVVIRLK